MENTRMTNPVDTYYKKVKVLFERDDCFQFSALRRNDSGIYNFTISISDEAKYYACKAFLKENIQIGNMGLKITIEFNEGESKRDALKAKLETLFRGNPVFDSVVEKTGVANEGLYEDIDSMLLFCQFNPMVLQFFDDEITNLHGLKSVIPGDVATLIMKDIDGVNYTTRKNEVVSKVGGEPQGPSDDFTTDEPTLH